MSNITKKFEELRSRGTKGFIPFITAGDPDPGKSLLIALKLIELGADIIELGVPFSDPMADGPTIQRSSERALKNGTNLRDVLCLAEEIKKVSDLPLVLFSYFNPILRFGLDQFCIQAADAGIDGVLLTDVIGDEASDVSQMLAANDVDLISLIAPTTSDARLEQICTNARGFIYAVSRAGVTGVCHSTGSDAKELVRRARKLTTLPIAVGFGISTARQIEEVWEYADAAVVGSAIVAAIEQRDSPADVTASVESFVLQLLPQFAKDRSEI